jgi:toxin YhaV
MKGKQPAALANNGWTIFTHPLFLEQINTLTAEVESLKKRDSINFAKKNSSKRLAAITKLAFDVIPQDPSKPEYRQGSTLGEAHKHWYRAKFFQQYQLFFRYHAASKIIVYASVNNEDTKRAY